MISIIALLVAILLPALRQARQMAMAVQCKSNQRQIVLALTMYASDFDGWIMPPREDDYGGSGTLRFWNTTLTELGYMAADRQGPAYQCPAWAVLPGSSITTFALRTNPSSHVGNRGNYREGFNLIAIRVASEFGLLFDSIAAGAGSYQNKQYGYLDGDRNIYIHLRHAQRVNVAFADGSVRNQTQEGMMAIETRLEDRLNVTPDYHGYDEPGWYLTSP